MPDTPAEPPEPRRVLPRAARLSRLNANESSPVPASVEPIVEPVVEELVEPVVERVVGEAVVEVPLPAPTAPAPTEFPDHPPAELSDRPPAEFAPRRSATPPTPIGANSSDVIDLATSIAGTRPAPIHETTAIDSSSGAATGGAALRSVSTTSYAPAPEHTRGPVTFKPLIDPLANRSVIVSSFGLVLCLFPLLALAGLIMGAISLRRINASGGTLDGARTARFGILLGAAGFVIGLAFGTWFLTTQ